MDEGVESSQIIEISLEGLGSLELRNPIKLNDFIKSKTLDNNTQYFIFIDEIQFMEAVDNPYLDGSSNKITFVDLVLDLIKHVNFDVYITGSNSKMLSIDILTQFRDRGDEIKVYPLSYAEFLQGYVGPERIAFDEYCLYGGMPFVLSFDNHADKANYLKNLFENTYIRDIIERNNITAEKSILSNLLDVLSSSVGSLTNPSRISQTFASEQKIKIAPQTIDSYITYFENAFLVERVNRYDVKGRKYLSTPYKFFYEDTGLRNARLNFRQDEINHFMENIIFLELKRRGLSVDIGVVEDMTRCSDGSRKRSQLEVDFVVNNASERVYIQSALNIDSAEKRRQETASFLKTKDNFRKIVVVKDYIIPSFDDDGIYYCGIEDFLLSENIADI